MRLAFGLLALLLVTPAAAQNAAEQPVKGARRELPQAYATNHLELEIPFKITPGSTAAASPTAVQVYVSWDFGRNWHKYTEVPPDAGKFRFKAKKDAEFWFVTETVDPASRPAADAPKWPQMRLVIDTQKPALQANAAVNPSGKVELSWSAADPSLNPHSLKIEYQDARDGDAPWEPVTIPESQMTPSRGGLAGRIVFAPQPGLRAVNLRAEVADAASNKSYFHQQLAIPLADERPRNRPLPSPLAMDAGARRWPSDNRMPARTAPGASSDVESIARPAPEDGEASGLVANPHVRRDRTAASPSRPPQKDEPTPPQESLPPPAADQDLRDEAAAEEVPSPRETEPPPTTFPQLSAPADNLAAGPALESLPPPSDLPPPRPSFSNADIGPIGEEEPLPPPASAPAEGSGDRGGDVVTSESIPAGTQPRLTNTKRFSLDYDVDAVGPEGIAEVELWGTNDGGRTWLKWGADPDRTSPMEVEVTSEATYGFRVVILGKNGLEGNKPEAGDDADIWVSIDATRPTARITAAAYGRDADAGKLDIRWEAADANLAQRPVTLLYSDRPDGRFTVIAAGLENTGQYLWQFDPRSPRTIFLRLDVRDEAGNIASDQLSEPISIEGLIPKGRIRSLSPAPEPLPESGAFQSPLFR